MDWNCTGIAILVGFAVSVVSSAGVMLLGGYGGYLRLTGAVKRLQDEDQRIETRLEREVKTRAGLKGLEAQRGADRDLFEQFQNVVPNRITRAGILRAARKESDHAVQSP